MSISAGEAYLLWYYDTGVWKTTKFLGVPCLKSACDMWNYQQILFDLKPSLLFEFGTYFGGSALYFAEMLQRISAGAPVLTVDIDHAKVADSVRHHPHIELLECDSTGALAAKRILELHEQYPGPAFFIALVVNTTGRLCCDRGWGDQRQSSSAGLGRGPGRGS
jgi:cephalosporin hydroxylase